MKHWLVLLFLVLSASAYSQVVDSTVIVEYDSTQKKYIVHETMPEYPGGNDGLLKFLSSIVYPKEAIRKKMSGTVYVQFVIDEQGYVTNVVVARSSGHKLLDDAAVEHVSKMERWTPGTQSGKPVSVQYVMPLKFNL